MTALILLCDDEAHILRAAEIKLRKAGYEVITASDGKEGWEAILSQKPDLVFTDCQMPYLTGLELAERIDTHEETRGLPVLMLTAKSYEISNEVAQTQYGIRKVISKPFSPRSLVVEADAILGERTAATEPAIGSEA
jgi:two-component system alkaline phosphatase synthesis response regulator PhoP